MASKKNFLASTGGLVADAASLGFEWLYDPKRVAEVSAKSEIAFHKPNAEDFKDTMGYYIGAGKEAGDLSHYGLHLATGVEVVADNAEGKFEAKEFLKNFSDRFGYGGSYVGYIDKATRDTLNNLVLRDHAATEECLALEYNGDENASELKSLLISKTRNVTGHFPGPTDEAKEQLRKNVAATHDDQVYHDLATKMMHIIYKHNENVLMGADDPQCSAYVKLAAVLAAQEPRLEWTDAIRLTNNNTQAADTGSVIADMLAAAAVGAGLPAVIAAGKVRAEKLGGNTLELYSKAISPEAAEQSQQDFVKDVGMSCIIKSSFPAIVHAVAKSDKLSYREIIENNILAAGDVCGRATVIGAIVALIRGYDDIPTEWIQKTKGRNEALFKKIE